MKTDPPVTEQLSSEDFLERIRGINRIDEVDTVTDRIGLLIPIATDDPNQQVRYAAISRLSNFNSEDITPEDSSKVLSAARYLILNEKEPSCQAGAADCIAGLKLMDGFDDLVQLYETTEDWMLKMSITAGLGEMGAPRAFEFLKDVLDEENPDLLLVATTIGSLGELGDKRAVDVVSKYLDADDSAVRERAAIAVANLKGED